MKDQIMKHTWRKIRTKSNFWW